MNIGLIYSIDDQNYADMFKTFESFKSDIIVDVTNLKPKINRVDDEEVKALFYERFRECEVIILLLGKTFKKRIKYNLWQQQIAVELNVPLIVVNTNFLRSVDFDRCPNLITKSLSLHLAFHEAVIKEAIDRFPKTFYELLEVSKTKKTYRKRTYRFSQSIYEKHNLFTSNLS